MMRRLVGSEMCIRDRVISVQNYGSSDLLEIRKKNAKDYFIPISENTIKKIDLIKKIIITKNINDYIG